MLKTRITELFGIERPIVQGGLMWIAKSELAAAVANAGGIGFMTALSFSDVNEFRAEIHKCRELTDKPFARMKAELDLILADSYGIAVKDLMPWHYHDPFFQRTPLVYELDDDLKALRHYYLGDEESVNQAIGHVADQIKMTP